MDGAMLCAAPDPSPRLGALGILSAAEQPKFRNIARRTWMAGAAAREAAGGLAVRFVIRGIGASAEMHREVRTAHDVILLRAPSLNRRSGPLVSLIMWMECALEAWPNAGLIGKADDDVWIHLTGVELHLRLTLSAISKRSERRSPLMYWGVQETYSWDVSSHLPWGFAYRYGWDQAFERRQCMRESSGRIGPFHFAKGPCFFISTPLVRQMRRSSEVQRLSNAAIAAADNITRKGLLPYEDVFAGLGLALAAHGPHDLYAVHVGDTEASDGVFMEAHSRRVPTDYLGLAPSTLVHHEKYKHQHRIETAHRWASTHHCDPPRVDLSCPSYNYLGCSGARWVRCTMPSHAYAEAGCSTNVTRLSGGFSADDQPASASAPTACSTTATPPGPITRDAAEPTTRLRGTCAVTEFGASDCRVDSQGAWVVRGTLADCVRHCTCCERCRFVSFSKTNADCSWFSECDTSALLTGDQAGRFHTVQVRP